MWKLKDSIQYSLKSHLSGGKGGRKSVLVGLEGGDPGDKYPLMVEACVRMKNSRGTQMEVFY